MARITRQPTMGASVYWSEEVSSGEEGAEIGGKAIGRE